MKHFYLSVGRLMTCIISCLLLFQSASAQTDMDAIMLPKNYFCSGAMYSHSSWKDYWEGTFKRSNLNLGTVTTQMVGIMGNYGISNKLNVLFNVPYVFTKASAGTLKGMNGIQDLSLTAKWMPLEKEVGKGTISLYALGGVSLPLTNYVADFLPLSIGMHSKDVFIRGMADYQLNNFFITVSGTYTRRSNINIDRTAYYTTEMHYTNEVKMPDMAGFNFRTGYRNSQWIAEAVIDNFTTLGGYDIRKNDMPFPSNKMNGTRAGVNFKYSFTSISGLELTGGGNYIIAGRNIGQSTTINAGVFYIIDLTKKKKTQK
jgi:hypothetical protein